MQIFTWLADYVVYDLLHLEKGHHLTSAIHFFIEDTSKIFFLLLVIIFIITYIRSYLTPEKVRSLLVKKGKNVYFAHLLADLVGIITPFCSCSAVPLFIGFVEAGVPLGVTFTYLIAAPTVNEVALVLLYGLFGWQIAAIYILSGEVIAFFGGIIIGAMKLEKYVEDYVYENVSTEIDLDVEDAKTTFTDRVRESFEYTINLIKKIGIWVIIGIGMASGMHGWAPTGFLAQIAGPGNPFAVLVAVLIGIPLYSNAAGMIPVVSELIRLGVPVGTALAFMMSVTAVSLPETILLRQVIKPQLIAIFLGIVTLSIIFTGYLFNFLLP
ncbi:permease [Thermodesulfobium sp.]